MGGRWANKDVDIMKTMRKQMKSIRARILPLAKWCRSKIVYHLVGSKTYDPEWLLIPGFFALLPLPLKLPAIKSVVSRYKA
jgi:hypothetical protein